MGKVYCEVCKVPMTSEEMMAVHERGKKHKKKLEEVTSSERKIFATLPKTMRTNPQEMKEYFSQFGEVVKSILIPQLPGAEITFASIEGRDRAMSAAVHKLDGVSFAVGPYVPLSERKLKLHTKIEHHKKRETDEALVPIALICKQALEPDTCEEQVEMFSRLLELPDEAKQRRKQFCRELQEALQRFIPEVALSMYGSTVSGLGTKFGDLDLFLDLDTSLVRHTIDMPSPLPIPDLGIKFPNLKMSNGLVTLESLLKETKANQLLFFTAALRNSPLGKIIRNLKPVTSARVPVLKFSHYTAAFDCDLGFGARMSVVNTRLMQLLLRIDDRFVKMLYVLRMWAKQNRVTNYIWQQSLHSYALTLLVYFYLENTSPPVLPSVKGLIDICTPLDVCTVSGWNCSFTEDMMNIRTFLVPDYNRQSVPDLIEGFFNFYANMDLFNVVICPHSGRLVDIMTFRENKKQDPRLESFVMKHLHIQDPLELGHNVVGHIQQKAAIFVISEEIIRAAIKVNQNGFSWTLRDIIPSEPAVLKHRPEPDHGRSVFVFQPALLPEAFRSFGGVDNMEAQWHQWIVELAMKALSVLRMEHEILEHYDESMVLFPSAPGEKNKTTAAPPVARNVTKDVTSEPVASSAGGSKTDSDQTSKSPAGDDICLEPQDMDIDSDSGSSATHQGVKRDLEDPSTLEPRMKKKLKCNFEFASHPSLKNNAEKRLKEETVIKCRTFCKAWFRNHKQIISEVDKNKFKDMFSYEEELTRRILESNESYRKTDTPQIQFVVKLQRLSFLHTTRMEMTLSFHQQPFYIPFLVGIAKLVQKLINSELDQTDWRL